MAAGAHSASRDLRHGEHISALDGGRTPAQLYCLLIGASLLLAGLLGFLAEATFGTPASGERRFDNLIVFEVNAWHNLVHLGSGVVLLAGARRRASAKAVALGFGVVYGLVAILGFIDGDDVLGILPVNLADNLLHVALSALGIAAALVSPAHDVRGPAFTSTASGPGATGRRIESSPMMRAADREAGGLRGHSPVGRRSERARAGHAPDGPPTTPRQTH